MFGPQKALFGAIAFVCLFGVGSANATTINFSTALPAGNLPESETINGITVSALEASGSRTTTWSSNVILDNQRGGPTNSGLGVCPSARDCGYSDNQIDTNGVSFDVIRLDFGVSTLVQSIGLSSLNDGSQGGFEIFGSNTALPNLAKLTPLAQGTENSVHSVDPTITLNDTYRYFFVTATDLNPSDCSSPSGFLLDTVTTGTHVTNTPEPYSAGMLGIGLLGLAAYRFSARFRRSA